MIWKAAFLGIGLSVCAGWAQRSMENLDRGLVAVKTSGGVFLSWQVLGTDAAGGSNASGSYTYAPNDVAIGDLDGDGQFELVLKWDPYNSMDNSLSGYTVNVILDAYKLNGTRLWRVDLGMNCA